MNTSKTWYAVYTKPRWEKKVYRLLQEKNIESYCPLNKVTRKWSDRVKVIEEPLFKSYVFVRISPDEQSNVRFIDGAINFVYWQGKPARIRDEEIALIRKFMSDYQDVEVVPLEIKPLDEVMVNKGVMVGETGKVIRIMHKYAEVELESLGYKLVAQFDKKNLLPVNR